MQAGGDDVNPIYILGCGAKKLDVPSRARDLYAGPLFKASLDYALAQVSVADIRILSAKHGLVLLDATLAPYDATWKRGPCITTRELSAQLPGTWKAARFVLLCGLDYRLALGYSYSQRFGQPMQVEAPLQHMGISQQVKWLKEQQKENTDEQPS